jgi:GAF domain-containing protein
MASSLHVRSVMDIQINPRGLDIAALHALTEAVNAAPDAEAALRLVGLAAIARLGDAEAAGRPGALKPGEREHALTAFFLVTPSREGMLLLGEEGWPSDQHRLIIDIAEGRPGWVVGNRTPLVLPNTDEDTVFTQIVSSHRMGSSRYAPLLWQGEALGLISIARQARHSFSRADLSGLETLAAIAAAAWMAHGGRALLAAIAPGDRLALDRAWR